MKRQQMMAVLLAATLEITGCSMAATADTTTEKSSSTTAASTTDMAADATDAQNLVDTDDMFSDRNLDGSYKENECVQIALDDEASTCEDKNVTTDGQTVTISGEGTYLISGSLSDGSLVVDVGDSEKVQLVLDGVSITNKEGAAIQVTQADKVFVTLADGSENTLTSESLSDDTDSNVDGAIFSQEDLTLNGSGSLAVTSAAHGIVSKDDLVITGGMYEITSEQQGLSGKDSVRIADGTFTIESGKDAIHSENSEDESKGWVYLAGGTYTLTAAGDGISASGVLQIDDGTYDITAGGGSTNATKKSDRQGSGGDFGQGGPGKSDMLQPQDAGAANEESGDMQNSGTNSSTEETSKTASVKKTGTEESGAKANSEATGSTASENTATGSETHNSGTKDTSAEDTSTKGVKAGGDLLVKDGTFTIDSCDDSLHTNGNLSICGGTYTLSTGDDGMHADEANRVSGGEITIETCYEGIEGQNVEISGGTIDITASDDGLNAAGGNDQSGMGGLGGDMFSADEDSWITISGGTVTIDATGDGIDSNGDLTVSGGNIFVSGPSDNGNGALDYNGTATITGGTLVAAGMSGMEQNFGSDSTQGSLMMNLTDNQSGEITLEDADGNTLVSYTPMREYNSVVISCAELSDGSTYTIHTGENSQEVTMEGLVYTDGEGTNAPGQGEGQKPQGGPMGDNSGDSDNSDNSDRLTLPQGQGNPPDTQNGERPQGDAPQGNPGDSSNEQTKEESDGQK